MRDDDDEPTELRLMNNDDDDDGGYDEYDEPAYPRLDEEEVTYTVSYYNCGECRVRHKTHDAALKCIAVHDAKRDRERRNRPPDPFTIERRREAARTVSGEDAAVAFAKKHKVELSRVVAAVSEARFYWARLLANDGVVRRETSIDALGFTEDAIVTLKSAGIDCVLFLLARRNVGWPGIECNRPLLLCHINIVMRVLGHWPLVKPGFLE